MVSDSFMMKSAQGIIATSEEVMIIRLIVEIFAADFRMPVVPFTAGSMRSRSGSSVGNDMGDAECKIYDTPFTALS